MQSTGFRSAPTRYRAGDYVGALRELEPGLELHPDVPRLNYHAACYESLAGQAEKPVAHLRAAVAGDVRFREYARRDPDFDPIRHEPAFTETIAFSSWSPAIASTTRISRTASRFDSSPSRPQPVQPRRRRRHERPQAAPLVEDEVSDRHRAERLGGRLGLDLEVLAPARLLRRQAGQADAHMEHAGERWRSRQHAHREVRWRN